MPDGVKRVIMIVALLAAALGPVLIIIGKTLSAIGTIMTWAPKLAGAISAVKGAFAALSPTMMANPIAIVIAAIAALVATFIYLWNTNEEFRQFWIRLWNEIKEVASRYGRRFPSFWFLHGTGSGIRRWLYGMASVISFPVCGLGLRHCSQRLSLQFLLSLWGRGMGSGKRLGGVECGFSISWFCLEWD